MLRSWSIALTSLPTETWSHDKQQKAFVFLFCILLLISYRYKEINQMQISNTLSHNIIDLYFWEKLFPLYWDTYDKIK